MRNITIKHDKLYQILSKKGKLIEEGRELSKQIEKLDTERNKIGLKVQKLKDKTVQYIEKETIETGEFEYIHSLEMGEEKGDCVITVNDAIEEYKKAYKERTQPQKEEK